MKKILPVLALILLISIASSLDSKTCSKECSNSKANALKYLKASFSECRLQCANRNYSCINACNIIKNTILKDVNNEYKSCNLLCKNTKIKEENKTEMKNKTIFSKSECIKGRGFYQQLCNGPYFDIVCTAQKYCICSGNLNYSCPSNSYCDKDFQIVVRKDTIPGWKTLKGEALGNIGICSKSD